MVSKLQKEGQMKDEKEKKHGKREEMKENPKIPPAKMYPAISGKAVKQAKR